VIPFRVSENWNVVTRTIVPVIHQPELAPGIGRISGLGDVQFSTFLSPMHPGGVIWGVGPIVSIPTATDDPTVTKKLGVGPTAVVRTSHGPWLVGAVANNVFSVAGSSEILPFGGATIRAAAHLGWGNAMPFLLTAEEFGAAEALRIGLAQEVVPRGQQTDRARSRLRT
jgi:hypothetical protein